MSGLAFKWIRIMDAGTPATTYNEVVYLESLKNKRIVPAYVRNAPGLPKFEF